MKFKVPIICCAIFTMALAELTSCNDSKKASSSLELQKQTAMADAEHIEPSHSIKPSHIPKPKYTSNPTKQTTVSTEKQIVTPSEGKPVSADYFDDVVFIGDSISEGLKTYVLWKKSELKVDYFGKAEFLTAISFGLHNALVGNKLPTYKGQRLPLEQSVAKMNVNKAYILLGENDLNPYPTKTIIKNYDEMINKLHSEKPNLKIFIQSITPITREEEKDQTYKNVTRAKVDEVNKALYQFAKEKGYYYLDVNTAVKDKEGFLSDKYSYSHTCHMRPEALELWIAYLRTHTVN